MQTNLIPIQITLQAASAADAKQLVQDLAGTMTGASQPSNVVPFQAPPQQVAPAAPVAPAEPVAQPPQAAPAVPVAPPQQVAQTTAAPAQAPTAVPTSAPSYSMDQLAVAATGLMDAGKDIVPLLGKFGVQALTQLPKEQYGNFATELRAMGAQI